MIWVEKWKCWKDHIGRGTLQNLEVLAVPGRPLDQETGPEFSANT